ncbi:universal stress protein [Ekhidna sp. MALMAid0563]|uniref:universal stress protein n=1 Tax=Ekhidna sp. MALMAid0563 TaxID=3143937 RepID=UPI0032DF0617
MKQILVPYDFSKVAEHALDFACQIADKSEGNILLLNVIEHPTADSFKTMGIQSDDPMEQLYIKKMYERVQEKLAEVVSNAKYADDKIATKIQLGNAFNTIIDQITEEHVDLLIVGTEGAEGLNEFFVGSNTEKIVRKAQCPVISVSEKVDLEPIEKIVFASDFINTDDFLIEKVKSLQAMMDAQLKIVKINTPASFTSTRHDLKQMKEFVEKYGIENCTTEIYNYKNEEDGIIYYAEDVEADMIALGTHQRRGVGHFLAGSIAEDVVNHATIPVWTAHIKD